MLKAESLVVVVFLVVQMRLSVLCRTGNLSWDRAGRGSPASAAGAERGKKRERLALWAVEGRGRRSLGGRGLTAWAGQACVPSWEPVSGQSPGYQGG